MVLEMRTDAKKVDVIDLRKRSASHMSRSPLGADLRTGVV